MNPKIFQKVQKDINEHLVNNYKGETDVLKVLDLSRLKDDVDGLILEMVKQPSVYAYWANLRRIADEEYNQLEQRFEMFKASKMKDILEIMKSNGLSHPTVKAIDAYFHNEYKNNPVYTKYVESLKRWKERRDVLVIVERAVSARENNFRSLSYLLSNMMSNGLLHINKPGRRLLKTNNHPDKE